MAEEEEKTASIIECEVRSEFLDWVDIRNPRIGAIKFIEVGNGRWTLCFNLISDREEFDSFSFPKLEELVPFLEEKQSEHD